ncbi:putative electron transfer flavoprotein subunit, partial [Tyrophagus putrescentiae]
DITSSSIMGKGYNNFMSKKPFHPASKDNIKRVWMAEQRSIDEKKKEDDMRLQYEKEQDLYNNRLLVAGSDSKDKLSLNFMYEAPAGLKRPEKEIENPAEPEFKFEWQRNAPRESFAKNNMDIRDQPFGIQVRNVRCLKCHKWGHVNTDRECPLFNAGSLVEPQQPQSEPAKPKDGSDKPPQGKSDQTELIRNMKDEQGLALKKSLYGSYGAKRSDGDESNQQMLSVKDPEVAFLASLTPRDKKKLLKKLQKLTNAQRGIKDDRKVSKKKKSKKSKDKKSKKDKKSDKPQTLEKNLGMNKKGHLHRLKSRLREMVVINWILKVPDLLSILSIPVISVTTVVPDHLRRKSLVIMFLDLTLLRPTNLLAVDVDQFRQICEDRQLKVNDPNRRPSRSPPSRRHRSRSPDTRHRRSGTRSPPRGATNRSSGRHSPTYERKPYKRS